MKQACKQLVSVRMHDSDIRADCRNCAYTAGITISLEISRMRERPMFESVFLANLEAIEKCMEALELCAKFDPVAEGYRKNLWPIHQNLAGPNAHAGPTSTKGKRGRVNVSFPSNEVMLEHILDLFRRMYGGEETILDQNFLTSHRESLPENYRFMYHPPSGKSTPASTQEPSPYNGQIYQLQHQRQHEYWPSESPKDASYPGSPYSTATTNSSGYLSTGSSNDLDELPSAAVRTPPYASEPQYPHRSKEEYEAFFKRAT